MQRLYETILRGYDSLDQMIWESCRIVGTMSQLDIARRRRFLDMPKEVCRIESTCVESKSQRRSAADTLFSSHDSARAK